MKLSLRVLTPGKLEGRDIPINLFPFFIGRDPKCHLRPASAIISKHHCAFLTQRGRFVVRDLGSANGTFVNDQQVHGEQELRDGDRLQLGPLLFGVHLEGSPAVDQATPLPPTRESRTAARDDEAAAVLRTLLSDSPPPPGSPDRDRTGIPTEATLMLTPHQLSSSTRDSTVESEQPDGSIAPPAEPPGGDAVSAAVKTRANPDVRVQASDPEAVEKHLEQLITTEHFAEAAAAALKAMAAFGDDPKVFYWSMKAYLLAAEAEGSFPLANREEYIKRALPMPQSFRSMLTQRGLLQAEPYRSYLCENSVTMLRITNCVAMLKRARETLDSQPSCESS